MEVRENSVPGNRIRGWGVNTTNNTYVSLFDQKEMKMSRLGQNAMQIQCLSKLGDKLVITSTVYTSPD
jgi:hypothetical protein